MLQVLSTVPLLVCWGALQTHGQLGNAGPHCSINDNAKLKKRLCNLEGFTYYLGSASEPHSRVVCEKKPTDCVRPSHVHVMLYFHV